MKKILSVLFSIFMCLCSAAPAMAASVVPTEGGEVSLIYSPDFPDAYIIQSQSIDRASPLSVSEVVSAIVFVEEKYGLDDNGNLKTTSSRLLSKEEVMAIGIEAFEDMEIARHDAALKTIQTREESNARGKLAITFSWKNSDSRGAYSYDLTGEASWSAGPGLFNGDTNPASGSDYMGIVWSGGFTGSSTTINTTSNFPMCNPHVLNECASIPNAGRVWEFTETWNDVFLSQSVVAYLTNIRMDITISKNYLTGGGNTAEAVLKYIHTYESSAGAISIEATSEGVAGGFTLTAVAKQWAIVCTLTGIPY